MTTTEEMPSYFRNASNVMHSCTLCLCPQNIEIDTAYKHWDKVMKMYVPAVNEYIIRVQQGHHPVMPRTWLRMLDGNIELAFDIMASIIRVTWKEVHGDEC